MIVNGAAVTRGLTLLEQMDYSNAVDDGLRRFVAMDLRAHGAARIELKALLADQVKISHPEMSGLDDVAYMMFRWREADGAIRTCTTLKSGRVDCSPRGTGSSANLAIAFAHGEVKVGDSRNSRSTIGGEFLAEATGDTSRQQTRRVAAHHRAGMDLWPRRIAL